MKRNVNISSQLLIGFSLVLAFVILLGIVTFVQTQKLYEQETILFEHPLQAREAVDEIKVDILTVRVASRDIVILNNEEATQQNLEAIRVAKRCAGAFQHPQGAVSGPVVRHRCGVTGPYHVAGCHGAPHYPGGNGQHGGNRGQFWRLR